LYADGPHTDAAGASDRPILVFGAAGQLGEAMTVVARARWRTVPLTRADVDLTSGPAVRNTIADLRPWAIVNCAGYNNVDGAEDQPAVALGANALAVKTLATAARDVDAVLVHYSSDFVFDGEADRPYTETSRPNPQSVYAASKLLGEWLAADVPVHYVLRVESLFGGISRRKSSLDTIIERLASGVPVRVFTDRVVSPSYVWDVAESTAALLQLRPAPGVYHCVNSGRATWHDVATEVQRQLGVTTSLEPITLAEVRLKAVRPRYCALSNEKLRGVGVTMPTWQDAVGREIAARGHRRPADD
jgi:dTDP-4-dehydrorhamnose reductase